MSDPKDVDVGTGIANMGKQDVIRRTANVNRAVESTVRSNASKANRENVVGPRGTTAAGAKATEHRGSEGERAFGKPL